MHTLRYNYNDVSVHINSYMFRPSLAHHQRVHSFRKQSLDLIIISNAWNCAQPDDGPVGCETCRAYVH